jgi:hypothetical protein
MSRIEIRTGFFVSIYSGVKRILPEIYDKTNFGPETEKYLIPLFFMMSDRYKTLRLHSSEHRTNDTKKAALTIAAIMAMRPIIGPADGATRLNQFYANPVFALACATAIIKKPLYAGVEAEKIQFYSWLDTLKWPSTEPYLRDAEAQSVQSTPEPLALTRAEISQIDMMVLKLVDSCRCIDLEQRIYDQNPEEET